MPLKVGPNEAERFQIIMDLRAGRSFAEATAALRKSVEPDWFERNEEHLHDVAEHGEVMPSPVALPMETSEPAEPDAPTLAESTRKARGKRQ